MLESAYGTGPAYQQPAMDDFGYGDPGYSDPSYEGPKTPYANPAFPGSQPNGRANAGGPREFGGTGYRPSGGVPGYQVPEVRDPSSLTHQGPGYAAPGRQSQPFAPLSGRGDEIWPVTGAQEALPDTGPQPAVPGGSATAAAAYPEEWYMSPRLDDRGSGDSRPSRSADPRLAGMTYGELRYEDPEPPESGHDEPLDDESWYQELRRSTPRPRIPSLPAARRVRAAAPSTGRSRQVPRSASRPAIRSCRTGHPATASPARTAQPRSPRGGRR